MESTPNQSILMGPTCSLNPVLLNRVFEKIANSSLADNIAVIYEDCGTIRKHKYCEIENLTNLLARLLRQIIVQNNLTKNSDGDYVIAVSMAPSDYLIITLLAIWKAGAAYLPLDTSFPRQRVEHIFQEAHPAVVISDKGFPNYENTFQVTFFDLISNCKSFSSERLEDEECLPKSKDEIAVIIYTSGSSGVPKGVRLSHTNLLNRLLWQFKTFPYSKTETTGVFKTSLTFVDSISEIWGPLLSGLAVLIVPKSITLNPEKLVDVLEKYKIERLVLVPSLLRALLIYFQMNSDKQYLTQLRTWICSGETLIRSLAMEFYKYFPTNEYRLCNFYGSTEVMGDVTYYAIRNVEQLCHTDKVPIGLPVDNTNVYILDPYLHPVKPGEVGELFVSGLNIATGYVNGRDPEKFLKNPLSTDLSHLRLFRTGDFARIDNNAVMYEGRMDSQIKIRGHRVDISEVENAVNAIDGLDKAAVLCYKLGEPQQTLLAFVTSKTLNEFEVEKILKKTLVGYMVPQVIMVDTIPLLINGKIDRRLLLKNYEDIYLGTNGCPDLAKEFDFTGVCERKMELAKALFETVASVLHKSRAIISSKANFYSIGGTSLNSIATISVLRDMGYYISIENFITAGNLGEVIDRIMPDNTNLTNSLPTFSSFSTHLLLEEHKTKVIDMVTASFHRKSEWRRWVSETSRRALTTKIVEAALLQNSGFCFVVKSHTGTILAVAISFDARDEPEFELEAEPNIEKMLEFFEYAEKRFRDNYLPHEKGKVFHNFLVATNSSLNSKENITVVRYVEEQIIQTAKRNNFEEILTLNTSLLTQQLAVDLFHYETIADYQVNKFIAKDGTIPFKEGPDYWKAYSQRKILL